jgi:polar amino acid transport system substrate-binding protein
MAVIERVLRKCDLKRMLCGAFTCLLASHSAAAEPVRLATHDQAPYGTYLADKTFDGVAVQVISCVMRKMGRAYAIQVYPWERAQKMAEWGEVDGFFPATIKPERLVWADASAVIADQKWVWYLPINSKLDPLSPTFKTTAKVGAHFGSNRLKMLEAENYNVVFKPLTDELLLTGLVRGRADAILGGNLAIASAMKEQGVDPKSYRTVVATDNPLHAYFGRKFLAANPAFIKQFDSWIPSCR